MYEIAICDDELKICEIYKEKINILLEKHELASNVHVYSSEYQFINECKIKQFQLVFLDIDMPNINGMSIATMLRELIMSPLLVFVTNQDSLVYETFQFQPLAFIRKSHFEEEIETVLLRCFDKLTVTKSTYTFRSEAKLIQVKLEDIMYFEADRNYLKLIVKDEVFRIRETLQRVENELCVKGFLRIHKGFLVNQDKVYQLSGDTVILENGSVLPIGRTNREQIKQQLMRYMTR